MRKVFQIVLADDDLDDHFLFLKAMDSLPFETSIISVLDGEKLMEYLHQNIQQQPDVIFIDMHMPRKSGAACLAEIRFSAACLHIPVVMYSTSLPGETAELMYKYGADLCVQKQTDLVQLRTVLHEIIKSLSEGEALHLKSPLYAGRPHVA